MSSPSRRPRVSHKTLTPKQAIESVHRYICKIAKQHVNSRASFEDLYQEGCIATLKALESWDSRKGSNFMTWVYSPIWWAISRASQKDKNLGLTGQEADIKQRKTTVRSFEGPDRDQRPEDTRLSLHETLGKEWEPRDCLALERLADAVSKLEPREREIIRLRYVEGLPLHKIGAKIKLSKERVRQIEVVAISRIKDFIAGTATGEDRNVS